MNDLTKIACYNNIIYDFDRTIAIIDADWTGWHDYVEKLFKSYDPDVIYPRSTEIHRLQNVIVKKFGNEVSKKMSDFNREYEFSHIKTIIPNTELINFIKKNLAKNQYIVSNQNRLLLNKLLDELDIKRFFKKIVTRDDVLFIKPDPEGLLKIINNSKNLSDFIYVGDAKVDEDVAKEVGIAFENILMDLKKE